MPAGIDRQVVTEKITGPLGVRIRALLALFMVLGIGSVGTFALWSNSASATSGEFRTGVVDLRGSGVKTYAFTGTTPFTLLNMLPGESRAASLRVQNTLSSLPLTYTVSASVPAGSPALANHLRLAVFSGAALSNGTANGLTTGTCSGTQLGSATLSTAASVVVVNTPQPLDPGPGSTQKPSTQDLCLVVSLAATAPVSVQNQTVPAITVLFDATTT